MFVIKRSRVTFTPYCRLPNDKPPPRSKFEESSQAPATPMNYIDVHGEREKDELMNNEMDPG